MVVVTCFFDIFGNFYCHFVIVSVNFILFDNLEDEFAEKFHMRPCFASNSLQSLIDPFTNPNGASASTGRRSFWGGSGGGGSGGGGGNDGRR